MLIPNEYPCTPPPSPRGKKTNVAAMSREENLVLINVTMVDKDAPNYVTQYNGVSKMFFSHQVRSDRTASCRVESGWVGSCRVLPNRIVLHRIVSSRVLSDRTASRRVESD